LEEKVNKNELVYALFRAAVGLVYMQYVFFGRLGNVESRMENAVAVMMGTIFMVGLSVFMPHRSEAGKILLFTIDTVAVTIGFLAMGTMDSNFIYFVPLLVVSAGIRFGTKTGFGAAVIFSLLLAGSAIPDFWNKTYQLGFWTALNMIAWLACTHVNSTSEEKKFKLMYMDQERENSDLLQKIDRLEKRMQSQTIVDPVTGLKNFRYFRLRIEEEISRANRHKYPFSLCLIEIDDFDEFRRRHGESEWRRALLKISGKLREQVRDTDLLGRYNENQFLALFPQADAKQALVPTVRIKKAIEILNVGPDSLYTPTMCFGISCFPDDVREVGGLLSLSSAALKKSKERGKGMVTIASSLFLR